MALKTQIQVFIPDVQPNSHHHALFPYPSFNY